MTQTGKAGRTQGKLHTHTKKAKIRKKENKIHNLQKIVIRSYLSPDVVRSVKSILRIF